MIKKVAEINTELYDYILAVSLKDHPVLKKMRYHIKDNPLGSLQIPPEQSQLMMFLVKLINARKTLDIGTFKGYSALAVALAMPDDSLTISCDLSRAFTQSALQYWEEAGVDKKIELRIGPAVNSLENLINEGHAATFDFIFIDADKENYNLYYEKSLILLRKNGLIAIDNVLLLGAVIDKDNQDDSTNQIRNLNLKIYNDERVDMVLLPISDGMTLLFKK